MSSWPVAIGLHWGCGRTGSLTSRQPSQDQSHTSGSAGHGQANTHTPPDPAKFGGPEHGQAAEMGVRSSGRQASGPVARKTSRLAHRRSSWMAPFRRGRPFGTGREFREPVQVCRLSARSPSVPNLPQTLQVPPWTRPWRWLRASARSIQGSFGGCLSGAEAVDNAPVEIVGVTTDVPVVVGVCLIDDKHLACQPVYPQGVVASSSALPATDIKGADCSAPRLRKRPEDSLWSSGWPKRSRILSGAADESLDGATTVVSGATLPRR